MKIVGDFLYSEALRRSDRNEVDLFARSAVNRYYYSCFLAARKLYTAVFPAQAVPGHKSFPEAIAAGLRKRILKALVDAANKGTITESERKRLASLTYITTDDLQRMLSRGYVVRCIADYEPDKSVNRDGASLVLAELKVSEVASWAVRVEKLAVNLRKEWKNLGF